MGVAICVYKLVMDEQVSVVWLLRGDAKSCVTVCMERRFYCPGYPMYVDCKTHLIGYILLTCS